MKSTYVVLGIFITLFSCKKDVIETPPPPIPTPPKVEITRVAGVSAVLQATYISTIKKEPQIGSYTFFEGVAHATFTDANENPAIVTQVICEGHTLERDKDTYHSSGSHPYGIDFGSSVHWKIEGKGDVPNFSFDLPNKVPEIGNLNVHDSINSQDSLWLKIDTKSPFNFLGTTDSIKLSIIGSYNELHYTLINPMDSVGLSSSQLSSCGKGTVYLAAEAMFTYKKSHQGYPVAFVNKGIFYKPVWLY